jgi:hypothetical protein
VKGLSVKATTRNGPASAAHLITFLATHMMSAAPTVTAILPALAIVKHASQTLVISAPLQRSAVNQQSLCAIMTLASVLNALPKIAVACRMRSVALGTFVMTASCHPHARYARAMVFLAMIHPNVVASSA